jgi:DNA modification methylase
MDAVDGIKLLDNESIDCIVTSPPYWACRDYGISLTKWPEITYRPNILYDFTITVPAIESCLGLEEDPVHFIAHTVYIFRLLKEKLKKTGTLWLNLGDTYSQPNHGSGGSRIIEDKKYKNCPTLRRFDAPKFKNKVPNKNLMGIPWAVAEALKAEGWYLRMDIIWHKPNPMPESAKDRPTKAHEYLFLLSKSKRYYYNYKAIMEPVLKPEASTKEDIERAMIRKRSTDPKGNAKTFRGGAYCNNSTFNNSKGGNRTVSGNVVDKYGMKNKRDVWTIASQPFSEAHFATFPPKLVEPCILAGCPVGGVVLDPFMGSGTTKHVALQNQRNCIGFDLNPEYIQIDEEVRNKCIQIKMQV